jgi:hypothetical protein
MKISELLDGIRQRDILLPEFQKEYLWSKENAKALIESLMKGFPIGTVLLWKTEKTPQLRNVTVSTGKLGTTVVILDGYQRLTALYMLFKGEAPPYYKKHEITEDPRDLYFNFETGQLEYFEPVIMKRNARWQRVVDCMVNDIDVFEIAKRFSASEREAFYLAQIFSNYYKKLRGLLDIEISTETLPPTVSLNDALEISNKHNEGGTSLSRNELIFALICEKNPNLYKEMGSLLQELARMGFPFNQSFYATALLIIVGKHTIMYSTPLLSAKEIHAACNKLTVIFKYLIKQLNTYAYIDSLDDLSDPRTLLPIIYYLSQNDNEFPNDDEMNESFRWLYLANVWSRYTFHSDQRLENDITVVTMEKSPWNSLCALILQLHGRLEPDPLDIERKYINHPFFKAMLILAKVNGAVDCFSGETLRPTENREYFVKYSQIFSPMLFTYSNTTCCENEFKNNKKLKELANLFFIKNNDELGLSNTLPDQYLQVIEEINPGSLQKQFIPMDKDLWDITNFDKFLIERRKIVVKGFNKFIDSLKSKKVVEAQPLSADQLVSFGQNALIGFVGAMQTETGKNQSAEEQARRFKRFVTSFVSFLNSEGGTILLGVLEDGQISGLNVEFKLGNESADAIKKIVSNIIKKFIGIKFIDYAEFRLETVGEKVVCVIKIQKADEPVYIKMNQNTQLFIRLGAEIVELPQSQTAEYIATNWM